MWNTSTTNGAHKKNNFNVKSMCLEKLYILGKLRFQHSRGTTCILSIITAIHYAAKHCPCDQAVTAMET